MNLLNPTVLDKPSPKIIGYLFIGFALFFSFWKLGYYPVYQWDEARHGVNAFEMLQHGDLWNYTYNDMPDRWNQKPPLMIWAIAVSYKIWGYNEWALRFPAGLATFVFFLVSYQLVKLYENDYFAFWVGLILMSTKGIVGYHVGRTGDCDAFLVCFLTISIYYYLKAFDFDQKYHYLTAAVSWVFAFYSKGFAAALILPSFLLYPLIKGKIKPLLSNYFTWGGIIIGLLGISSYFFFIMFEGSFTQGEVMNGRNNVERMIFFDVIERFSNPQMHSVGKPFGNDFLFVVLDTRMNLWNYVLFLSLFWGIYQLYQHKKTWKSFLSNEIPSIVTIAVCIIIGFLSLLLPSVNKAEWYLSPILLFFSILIVKGCTSITNRFRFFQWLFIGLFLFTFVRNLIQLNTLIPHSTNNKDFLYANESIIKKMPTFILGNDSLTTQDIVLYAHWLNKNTTTISQVKQISEGSGIIFTKGTELTLTLDSINCNNDLCIANIKNY